MQHLQPSWNLLFPTRVHFARGAAEQIPKLVGLSGRKVFLIGYGGPCPLKPLYDHLAQLLKTQGCEVLPYLSVVEEPTLPLAAKAYQAWSASCPEVILAVGGGSVIDLAKLVALQCAKGQAFSSVDTVEELSKGSSPDKARFVERGVSRQIPQLVAVPTTCGTGSEVTSIAVVRAELPAEDGQLMPVKLSVYVPELRPDIAVVDPALCESLPDDMLRAQASDALAHLVESAMSRGCHRLGLLLAKEGLRTLGRILAPLAEGKRLPHIVDELSWAGILGGYAVESCGVTAGHALAHALGAVLGMPHSVSVGLTLPAALAFNRSAALSRLAELEAALAADVAGGASSAPPGIEGLVDQLAHWSRVQAREWLQKASTDHVENCLVANAELGNRLSLRLNPRRIRREDLLELVREVLSHVD